MKLDTRTLLVLAGMAYWAPAVTVALWPYLVLREVRR